MAMERTDQGCAVSRRTFLATTSGALAGMAAFGLVNPPPPPGGIRNAAASCTMARASMSLASTRTSIIKTTG